MLLKYTEIRPRKSLLELGMKPLWRHIGCTILGGSHDPVDACAQMCSLGIVDDVSKDAFEYLTSASSVSSG